MVQRYLPGKARKQPYYLELIVRLPARSVTKFSIEMDYLFLKWQEYPPDANHGFYMGPAIITASLPIARNYTGLPLDGSTISSSFNASRDGYLVQMRTETILITLPTPDFSMPYNVICLACTAVALAFGPLHNISTKRLVLKHIQKSWRAKLVASVTGYFKSKPKTDWNISLSIFGSPGCNEFLFFLYSTSFSKKINIQKWANVLWPYF